MNLIIGTGGHIDHGKTALVGALTGTDTDRLPEEKRRGISIDLGFSHLRIGDTHFGIVDVPGHEAFIRNMLAGATGFDLLLLVVAADEGVMPQTREHLAIATLLDVPAAVVALTKADLVEPEWLELAREDVAGVLADHGLAHAAIVPTSATTGQGLDALRAAILDAVPASGRHGDDLFRMPVDRVFTVKGTGTVVTGTVWSGGLEAGGAGGRTIRLEPGGGTARVRELQVHGQEVDRISAGQRAAVALSGVDRADVRRGDTLVTDERWTATSLVTARVRLLGDTDWELADRQRVRVHLGTAEALGRVRLLDSDGLGAGAAGWVQVRLERPVLARAGDRFILRSYSPVTTIGGGRVAEPYARRRKRTGAAPGDLAGLLALVGDDSDAALAALLEAAGGDGVAVAALPVVAPAAPAGVRAWLEGGAVVAAGRAFAPAVAQRAAEELLAVVRAYHARHPLRAGIPLEALRRQVEGAAELVEHALEALIRTESLRALEGRVAEPSFRPSPTAEQRAAADAIASAIADGGAAPPDLEDLEDLAGGRAALDEILAFLEHEKTLVRVQPGFYLHRPFLDDLAGEVARRLGGRQGLGPAEFREVINVSRKHLIPILEHLDVRGVTVRQGEGRAVPAR